MGRMKKGVRGGRIYLPNPSGRCSKLALDYTSKLWRFHATIKPQLWMKEDAMGMKRWHNLDIYRMPIRRSIKLALKHDLKPR